MAQPQVSGKNRLSEIRTVASISLFEPPLILAIWVIKLYDPGGEVTGCGD
jgi:hypothetical protein